MKVAIVDYGMGNIRSVYNALRYLGAKPVVASAPPKIRPEPAFEF